MKFWKSKSKKQKLCERYKKLMGKAYKVARNDRQKSEQIHERADEVLYEIKCLNLNKLH
jgi:thiamine biosynthesis lipoprotein ApbE